MHQNGKFRRSHWPQNIVRVMKSRVGWAVLWCLCDGGDTHAACWWRNLTEIRHLEDLGIDGRKIMKCILGGRAWTGLIWLRIGTSGEQL